MGGWNLYFLGKLALLWGGYLNYHPLANLVFAAFLLFPLSTTTPMRRARSLIALPIGIGLFYHDTWLPGFESIVSQGGQVFSFTADYWLELFERFINWEMVGVGFVMLTTYLFLAQWLRFTPWVLGAGCSALAVVLPSVVECAAGNECTSIKRGHPTGEKGR
ncbi:MAG: cellulose biosynthesis protein BcsG [Aeromonas sp.]